MSEDIEAEIRAALRDVLMGKLRPGRDGTEALEEVAGAAYFEAAATGAFDLPFTPELVPDESIAQVDVFDLRHEQPPKQTKSKIVGGRTLMRDPKSIDAIMLHQTAVDYGDGDPRQRARAEKIPYHTMVFREGWVVLSRPVRSYTNHGGWGNSRSIGIGVEGLYPGLIGGSVWGSKPETPINAETLAALTEALKRTVALARAEGCPLKYLIAHRQSSKMRRSDPGEALWMAALPVAESLGLQAQPDWTIDDGKPIPEAWGGSKGSRY